jgi:DNA helicase-2/ATP-dependent DNA helicase PcrA
MDPNPQQQAVIDHEDGPCLVTAVPGSGKTASVTERIKHLVRAGKDPAGILAITFTNKAADEMRSRVAEKVGRQAVKEMTICTFHSMCAKILREYGAHIGLRKGWTIYDSDDQDKLIVAIAVGIVGDAVDKSYVKEVISFVEGQRNACMTDHEAMERYPLQGEQYSVATAYRQALRDDNAVDFTGLLSETLRLMRENESVLDEIRSKWSYVNVDEVQDTNIAQYEIVKLLVEKHRNILMVGDLDQSIYRFRNANPTNLLDFEKEFDARTLKLETNYRSTPEILACAQKLIERNTVRKETELQTGNLSGPPPRACHCANNYLMAEEIAREIRKLVMGGAPPREIAIFYRVNYVSRVIEQALMEYKIKYKVIGSVGFYDRREVKTTLALLRLMVNPDDRAAFDRVAAFCCKGVGPKSITKIIGQAREEKISVMEAVEVASEATKGLQPLVAALKADSPRGGVMALLSSSQFGKKIDDDSTKDNDRRGNVMEVIEDLERAKDIESYLHQVSLLSSQDDSASGGQVSLMTMHASKGLEFDIVFLSHANGGIIPHSRTMEIEDPVEKQMELEEERRLFYVAMTRARKRLAVFSCAEMNRKNYSPSAFTGQAGIPIHRY